MSRQINPHLFEDPRAGQNGVIAPYNPNEGGTPALFGDKLLDANEPGPFYDDLLARIENAKYQMAEWVKSINLKLDKVQQRFVSLDERLKLTAYENHERLAGLSSRVKDRNASDMKVEALIERHNQIVQSFELRLSQSQRVIENQALQLAKQQELIDDARRQIEKLKKL